MMIETRMASAKIKAKAKGTSGFLKSLEVEAVDLREGFARGADRTAMVTSFDAESFASSLQSKQTRSFSEHSAQTKIYFWSAQTSSA